MPTIAWSRRRRQLRVERDDARDRLRFAGIYRAAGIGFAKFCLPAGCRLEADRERAGAFVERSLAMGTALAPEIGYEKAAELVKKAYASGATIREVAIAESGLPAGRIEELLDPRAQAGGLMKPDH